MVMDKIRHIAPKRDVKEKKTLWRASSLGRCINQQLLSAMGFNFPMDAALLRKLAVRNAAHTEVQQWVVDNFHTTASEVYIVDEDRRCSGHIDNIIVESDMLYLIEVKTYAYKKIGNDPYWMNQVSFYRDTLLNDKNINKKQLPVKPIVIISDLNGELMIVEPDVNSQYIDVLDQLNMYWDTKLLPEYEKVKDCAKCPIKHICNEPYDLETFFYKVKGFFQG